MRVQNQRMSTFGSNQSQQAFQNSPCKNQSTVYNQSQSMKSSLVIKISQKLSHHVITIIRFSVCIFLGLILSSKISLQTNNQLSNGIAASSDILLDKGIRGVFPPLAGSGSQLYGKWQQMIMTSSQNTTSIYRKYTINIKQNGDLQLTSTKCKGDIKLQWHVFYYNICLREKAELDQKQMQIPNEKQDEQCIKEDGKFIQILTNSSIWSIHADHLYIVSEIQPSSPNKQISGDDYNSRIYGNNGTTNMIIFKRISLY